MRAIDEETFSALSELSRDKSDWIAARAPDAWARSIGVSGHIADGLWAATPSRGDLLALASDAKISSDVCFLAVMAWGGMRVSSGRRAWEVRASWIPVVDQIRSGALSRSESYELFRRFRLNNAGSGIGPAFFTKLIFFLDPKHNGYIMDQWTALSINALFPGNSPLVDLNIVSTKGKISAVVSDRNTAEVYDEFCRCLEETAFRLGLPDVGSAEETLFSNGGRKPGAWRKYLKDRLSESWAQSH